MSSQDHIKSAATTVRCVVLTIDDNTSSAHDACGKLAESILHEKGHDVTYRRIIKNCGASIREAMADALADEECEMILAIGGIGLSSREETPTVLNGLYERHISGFGEILSPLFFEAKGPAALMHRPSAGIIEGRPVFSLPLETHAVSIALEKLILPSLYMLMPVARK